MIARYTNELEIERLVCVLEEYLLECTFSNNECKFIVHFGDNNYKSFMFNLYGASYTDIFRIELLKTVINMIKYDCELSNIEQSRITAIDRDEFIYVYKYGKKYKLNNINELIEAIISKHMVELEPIDGENFFVGCSAIKNESQYIFSIIEGKNIYNTTSFTINEELSYKYIDYIYKITSFCCNVNNYIDKLFKIYSQP